MRTNSEPLPKSKWSNRWWQPHELLADVESCRNRLLQFEDVYLQKYQTLREAWIAATFGRILSQDRPVKIKMESDRFPDFWLCVRDQVKAFECTEVLAENRKRDREYREEAARRIQGLPPRLEPMGVDEEGDAAIPMIDRAIENKAKRSYSEPPHLLIYVSFFALGCEEPPITGLVAAQLANRWKGSFPECWLLWEGFIYRLWPNPMKIRLQSIAPKSGSRSSE